VLLGLALPGFWNVWLSYGGKAKPLHCWPEHGLSIWEVSSGGYSCAGGPAPLPAGISGIAALNPATGGMVNPNMAPVLDPATVPFQEGWIKLRGIPFAVSKADICAFFSVRYCPPASSYLQASFKHWWRTFRLGILCHKAGKHRWGYSGLS